MVTQESGDSDRDSQSETGTQQPQKEMLWDTFVKQPPEEIKHREACIRRTKPFLKVIVIIIFFLLLLFGLMVNNAVVFLAIAQFSRTYNITCVGYGNATHPLLKEVCVAHTKGTALDPSALYCSDIHGLEPQSVIEDLPDCPAAYMRWLWCLLLFMIIPYICIIARNLWLVCLKNEPSPRIDAFLVSLAVDTISTIGMCLFVFRALPVVDNTLKGICILMGTSVVPSLLVMLNIPKANDSSNTRNDWGNTARKAAVISLNILAFLTQVSVLFLLPVNEYLKNPAERFCYELPISLMMISIGWWENYADPAWEFRCYRQEYGRMSGENQTEETFLQSLREAKVKLSLAGNIWKVFLTILMAFLLHMNYKFTDWFDFLTSSLDCEDYWGSDVVRYNEEMLKTEWVILLAVGIFDTMAVYFIVRACAKIRIQAFTVGLATLLVTPVMLGSMVLICYHWTDDVCILHELRPLHMFWSCNKKETQDFFLVDYGWISIFWWLSQVWVSRHIWKPTADRLTKSKNLFVNPLVEAIVLGPWVIHNRRRIDVAEAEKKTTPNSNSNLNEKGGDAVPMIYMCATLWHETKAEMMEILKSLLRSDLEQFKRKLFNDSPEMEYSDYFEFEGHIFFDDAMTPYDNPEDESTVNDFVKRLVRVMDDAASDVHKVLVHVEGPIRYTTPYGGRLEWKLPGENKLIAHLKDKNKIRHKKRWSQVMYIYYLLSFKPINEIRDDLHPIRPPDADNTFILALDGDVEFKPDAVHKLVDLMKKDKKVGAACGRIHPVGTGPMVWYQNFEYAIGHWLQKSTEHVLGSVLCSPGCFSLFRSSALKDTNVARMYATVPTEAKHYVQYDQGEDRWLCTLLLQQGYRVEYCAASDAYTFVPDSFKEFFTQRRRWMPSTVANIIDLLVTWRQTIKKNDNISFLYIVYQAILLLASILGSGTIFLMIVGALQITTQDTITLTQSFLLNMVPVIVFIIICYVCKSDVQVLVAAVLTTAYSLLQMLVLVGIVIQIASDGPSSPNAVFSFFVAGTFILAALLHPQECLCVVHGFIYFLAVPSMYMLLMIYAFTNLHEISWGTREGEQTKNGKEDERDIKAADGAKNSMNKRIPFVHLGSASNTQEGFIVSLGNLCHCICCPRDISNPTTKPPELPPDCSSDENVSSGSVQEPKLEWIDDPVFDRSDDDPVFHTSIKDLLPPKEEQFFKELITKYLEPLAKERECDEKNKIKQELKELRNKMSGTYLLLNAIFVIVVFTLQHNVETVHLTWPWGMAKDGSTLILEPVGFMFLAIFGVIMLLQVCGMVSHRLTTFQHILSTTILPCEKRDYDDKRLQEIYREIVFDTFMSDKRSVCSTVKTSSQIAEMYRGSFNAFKSDPKTLEEEATENGQHIRRPSKKKREKAARYFVKKNRQSQRRLNKERGAARNDNDVELNNIQSESNSAPQTAYTSERVVIEFSSTDANLQIDLEGTASHRSTKTDIESDT